jgi:parallel beta-helix repeat protein
MYDVRIWVAPSGPPFVVNEVLTATSFVVPSGALSSGVRYGWTVNAGNSDGWSANATMPGSTYSPAFTVQVAATGPIRIHSDDEFTGANGVVSGSGTQADPYVIEGWTIDASSSDDRVGIAIGETSLYFVIRDCSVENAREYGNGISLAFTSNGRVENCVVRNIDSGISLIGCSNVVLCGNTIENCGDGIRTGGHSSDGVTISNNTVTGSTDTGIEFNYLTHSSASGNTVRGSGEGIYVNSLWFGGCTISNNTVQGNTLEGIEINDSENVTVSDNDTSNNGGHGLAVYCSHNTVSHNESNGNGGTGISLHGSYNTVSNNTANNNGGNGFLVGSGCIQNAISGNTANSNVMNGIEVEGNYSTISENTALSNNAHERYDPDGHPFYYDIYIGSPLPNTNTLEGNVYGSIYVEWP